MRRCPWILAALWIAATKNQHYRIEARRVKVRFTPDNPGPVAHSVARYVGEHRGVEISPAHAQAHFSYHHQWQRWRNQPGGQAEHEKQARDFERAAKIAAREAEKLAKHQAGIAEAPARRTARQGANGRNADHAFLKKKRDRIREAHVAALNKLVDEIADTMSLPPTTFRISIQTLAASTPGRW
jgi:hypothetical protein